LRVWSRSTASTRKDKYPTYEGSMRRRGSQFLDNSLDRHHRPSRSSLYKVNNLLDLANAIQVYRCLRSHHSCNEIKAAMGVGIDKVLVRHRALVMYGRVADREADSPQTLQPIALHRVNLLPMALVRSLAPNNYAVRAETGIFDLIIGQALPAEPPGIVHLCFHGIRLLHSPHLLIVPVCHPLHLN
jgi:hypothetical protein